MSPATIRIVSLVELKLALHKQLPKAPHASRDDRSAAPDRGHGRQDRSGARLYALAEEEIRIAEGKHKSIMKKRET